MNQTLIFIGRSGSGKGTQIDLLKEFFIKKGDNRSILTLATGSMFRDFLKSENFSAKLSKNINETGGLQPEFLTVYLWSSKLVCDYQENQHIITDGSPRKLLEAEIFDSAINFYKRENPKVVLIDVSEEVSTQRLIKRGRSDDNKEAIAERLKWYETDVVPVLNYFSKKDKYKIIKINGDQKIENVHREIISKLEL